MAAVVAGMLIQSTPVSFGALGKPILYAGKEVLIHLSCKDFNRNGLESAAWELASEGFHNILALSGDLEQHDRIERKDIARRARPRVNPRRGTRGIHVEPTLEMLAPWVYAAGGELYDALLENYEPGMRAPADVSRRRS